MFTDKITPFAITTLMSSIFGYFRLKPEDAGVQVPIMKLAKVSATDLFIHIMLMAGLMRSSYTLMVMANTCSLLSVVVIAAFFSGVKKEQVNQ